MLEAQGPNAKQISYWNEVSGPKWVALDGTIDKLITPLGTRALDAADARPGERVLDVGCGCGQTTIDLSSRVGSEGSVVGLDISTPMLAEATARSTRANASNVSFINADAQTHEFSGDPFDLIFSRFGVMFFSQPEQAFHNLRTSLRPGGRLVFMCWQKMEHNPWMTIAVKAVAPHVDMPAPAAPGAPGPFALSDSERMSAILYAAGFADIRCKAVDARIDVTAGASLDQTVEFLSQMGPAGALLREATPDARSAAVQSIRAALVPHQKDGRIEMGGAAWITSAIVQS